MACCVPRDVCFDLLNTRSERGSSKKKQAGKAEETA
jgi:hypothetical protein